MRRAIRMSLTLMLLALPSVPKGAKGGETSTREYGPYRILARAPSQAILLNKRNGKPPYIDPNWKCPEYLDWLCDNGTQYQVVRVKRGDQVTVKAEGQWSMYSSFWCGPAGSDHADARMFRAFQGPDGMNNIGQLVVFVSPPESARDGKVRPWSPSEEERKNLQQEGKVFPWRSAPLSFVSPADGILRFQMNRSVCFDEAIGNLDVTVSIRPGGGEAEIAAALARQQAAAPTAAAGQQPAAAPPTDTWAGVFSDGLSDSAGTRVSIDRLKGRLVGIYFSAHWCPPCRAFTPKLIEFRDKHSDEFEVVFVSSDKSAQDQQVYMKETRMAWLAVPWGSASELALKERFQVRSIPTLVVLAPDGRVLTASGRDEVAVDSERALARWKEIVHPAHSVAVGANALGGTAARVVGRLEIDLDGFQGQHKKITQAGRATVLRTFGHSNPPKEESFEVEVDGDGFFTLSVASPEGFFRIGEFTTRDGAKVKSAVPSPTTEGLAGKIFVFFSGARIEPTRVVDMGVTTLVIQEEGILAVRFRSDAASQMLSRKGFDTEKVEPVLDALQHYVTSGGEFGSAIAKALAYRQEGIRAKPLVEKARKAEPAERLLFLREIVAANPSYAPAYEALLDCLPPTEEVQSLESFVQRVPWSETLALRWARLCRQRSEPARSVPALEAIREGTSNLEVYDLLARAYVTTGRQADADGLLEGCWERLGNPRGMLLAASHFARTARPERAQALQRQFLAKHPDDETGIAELAETELECGRPDSARELFGKVKTARPLISAHWKAKKLKRYDLARWCLEEAQRKIAAGDKGNSLSELQDCMDRLETDQRMERRWLAYLKTIQDEHEYDNWQGPPYDLYVKRNPEAARALAPTAVGGRP